jgi:hypothetical protein
MRSRSSVVWFAAAWLFIAMTSGYDAYRCVVDQDELVNVELNPIAKALLVVRDSQVDLLIACKVVGTSLALGILCFLYYRNYRYTNVIILVLVVAQALLLLNYCPWIW